MTKYNKPTKGKNKTVNYEGATAYKQTPELELYSLACTSLMKDTFYEGENARLERLRALVKKVDPIFVAKLGVYARELMYLRSLPVVLTVELAKVHSGDALVSRMTNRVIQRVDEITEILSYYKRVNKGKNGGVKPLSNQIKKGIAMAFNKFDEYQFAKYDRAGDVTLRDAMFLVNPKPTTPEQEMLFKKIAEQTLEVPKTWETTMSKAGEVTKDMTEKEKTAYFRKEWEDLIDSKKVGYMALLRNLRRMLELKVSDAHIEKVANYLRNPDAVRKSKQLPFRFYTAYKELVKLASPYTNPLLEALNEAIWLSVDNLIGFNDTDTVLIASDDSGSMSRDVTPSIQAWEMGLLLAILLRKKVKKVTLCLFSSDVRVVNIPQNTNVLDAVRNAGYDHRPYGTEGWKVLDMALNSGHTYDKIFMFTDFQMWCVDERNRYGSMYGGHDNKIPTLHRQLIAKNPNLKLFLIDLMGYGNMPLDASTRNVYTVAGWSDKIFTVIDAIDKGKKGLDFIDEVVL